MWVDAGLVSRIVLYSYFKGTILIRNACPRSFSSSSFTFWILLTLRFINGLTIQGLTPSSIRMFIRQGSILYTAAPALNNATQNTAVAPVRMYTTF